jgi:hypothetical protein
LLVFAITYILKSRQTKSESCGFPFGFCALAAKRKAAICPYGQNSAIPLRKEVKVKATAFPLGFALGRKTQSGHLPCGQNSAIPLRKEVLL